MKLFPLSRHTLARAAQALTLALVAGAAHYAPDADARGGHRFGYFIGGAVVGAAVFAPRYAYPAPVYYYPAPVYYPPAVTYVSPPVVVQQAAPIVTQQAVPQAAPVAPRLSIEDRAQRLRSLCEQGLFTSEECRTRREQILQEM